MDLSTYLAERELSHAEFGRLVGVGQTMVSHWIAGRYPITAERARDIERATGGEVTRVELRPDLFGPLAPDATEAA